MNNFESNASPGFWANLNVFVPAWLLLNVTLGWLISMALMAPLLLVSMVTGPFGEAPWVTGLTTFGGPILIAAWLGWRWVKRGLIPAPILRFRRYRTGQALIGLANILLPGGFLALALYAKFIGGSESAVLGWLMVPVAVVALPAAAAGIWLVWSARSAPPAAELRPPSKAVVRHLGQPIGVAAYCERYRVSTTRVMDWIDQGKMQAYSERGVVYVADKPPPPAPNS
jgi:hypothetical protein